MTAAWPYALHICFATDGSTARLIDVGRYRIRARSAAMTLDALATPTVSPT